MEIGERNLDTRESMMRKGSNKFVLSICRVSEIWCLVSGYMYICFVFFCSVLPYIKWYGMYMCMYIGINVGRQVDDL